MLVQNLAHGRLVVKRLRQLWAQTDRRYLVFDTETKAISPYPKDDALTIARSRVVIWSIAYQGASYSFPTSAFSSKYPAMTEWADLLAPVFADPTITSVAHNWNYDANVLAYDADLATPAELWDTMLGCWVAAEYQPKSLKERAPSLGRFLRETKTVDFSNMDELAEYAEQDVVATEELYMSQRYGKVTRDRFLAHVSATGSVIRSPNPHFCPPFLPDLQGLSNFGRLWASLLEFPVLRATIRAEQRGFPFDMDCLRGIRVEVVKEKQNVLKQLFRLAKVRFNPNSSRDLGHVVDSLGIDYPFTTKKGARSFNAKCLQKVEGTHPFFDALGTYKRLEKLSTVYVGSTDCNIGYNNDCGLERWLNPDTGAIHATAGTIEAITGRGSSSRPNLQQIPARRDKFGIRRCFTATSRGVDILAPKYRFKRKLIILDYSQLELRIMALLSKDKAMSKILCDPKGDIHQHTADEFGVDRDPSAKNLNFLLLFGGLERMLAETLTSFGVETSVETARQYVHRHWEVYPRIKAKREEWCREHQANGFIRLFFGRTRTLPDADWSNDYGTHRAETQLANNAVQGTGQDCLKASIIRSDYRCINPDRAILRQAMIRSTHAAYLRDRARDLDKLRRVLRSAQCRLLLQVHDEACYSVAPSAAEECATILADIMSWFHYFPATSAYNVPLVAEGGIGDNWKAAKAKDAVFHVKAGYTHWEKYAH